VRYCDLSPGDVLLEKAGGRTAWLLLWVRGDRVGWLDLLRGACSESDFMLEQNFGHVYELVGGGLRRA
jgi:hypothetical protein